MYVYYTYRYHHRHAAKNSERSATCSRPWCGVLSRSSSRPRCSISSVHPSEHYIARHTSYAPPHHHHDRSRSLPNITIHYPLRTVSTSTVLQYLVYLENAFFSPRPHEWLIGEKAIIKYCHICQVYVWYDIISCYVYCGDNKYQQ